MYAHQHTLNNPISCTGIGVHSGRTVQLKIKPARVNHGIRFARNDLPGKPVIPAHFNSVVDTSMATVIGHEGCIVSTIEHLMACFAGFSIDNALVELDAYEMPIMDGSGQGFAEMLKQAGRRVQSGLRCVFKVHEPIVLKANGKSVSIYPASSYKITCAIEFDHPLIGYQTRTFEVDEAAFEAEICGARTFGFLHEYEQLKRFGLGRGCSLENVVVVDRSRVVNQGGLRFQDEFVRHKILDCLGDFSLLGMPILGHVVTHKAGHEFHHAFLKEFFRRQDAWKTITLRAPRNPEPTSCTPLNPLAISSPIG
ncbi:MAG: UDP-3-O-acyl-N-acetylglucosamine deacetylase [Desulfobacterales bacterium]